MVCVPLQSPNPATIKPNGDPPVKPDPLRVLMLTHRLPYPPDRGDRIRSYHMIQELAKHFDLAIACTSDEPVWLQHHQLLSTIAKRVAIQPISLHMSKIKSLHAMVTGKTITANYYYRQALADTIIQWHDESPFDVILTFCTGMIQYARLLIDHAKTHGQSNQHQSQDLANANPIRHIVDLVDVDSLKWLSYAKHSWIPMRWVYKTESRRLRKIEAGRFDHFDAVTVVSPAEADAYKEKVGHHEGLTVVGNGVDLDYFSPLPSTESKTIVFVGVLNYKPNIDGIVWFVQYIFEPLRKHISDAKLMVVGRHPTPQVEELANEPGVEIVGSVPDVRTYLREAAAVIAPMQIARGIQNKVLEAMACCRAVVCSSQAAEGLHAVSGEHLLIAQEPTQWIEHLQRVLTDDDLRHQLESAARQHVEKHYSWQQRLEPMINLLNGKGVE